MQFSAVDTIRLDLLLQGKLNELQELLSARKLHYQTAQNQPSIRNVAIDGQVESNLLTAVASGRRFELRRMQGAYRLGGGTLQLTNFSVETLGGRMNALAEMKHLEAAPQARVQASLAHISLKALQSALGAKQIKPASISGTLTGKIDASWKGSASNLRAHSDLFVQALASSRSNPSEREVPVNGALHADYDGSRQTIQVRDTAFRIPTATVTAQGDISDHSNLQVQIATGDLHQLAALATSFTAAQSAPPAPRFVSETPFATHVPRTRWAWRMPAARKPAAAMALHITPGSRLSAAATWTLFAHRYYSFPPSLPSR